jgi:ribosomal protein S18 acetylase RimI-like enzyme
LLASYKIPWAKLYSYSAISIKAALLNVIVTWPMILAEQKDKNIIANILSESFNENLSVNYIIRQDHKRKLRIKRLMEYSFDISVRFGMAVLSDDRNGCALIVYPEKNKITFRYFLATCSLILFSIGIFNLRNILSREAAVRSVHPPEPMNYLWFIGVLPTSQDQGTGTGLLREIIELSETDNKMICLETSQPRNLSWYQKFDFVVYKQLNFGFTLNFLRRDPYSKP